jgi:hypothetical protein
LDRFKAVFMRGGDVKRIEKRTKKVKRQNGKKGGD